MNLRLKQPQAKKNKINSEDTRYQRSTTGVIGAFLGKSLKIH